MDPQRQREIASEGGRAAHEKGTAHEFTSEEAREAGRKGGMARSANRRKAMESGSGSSSHASGSNSGSTYIAAAAAARTATSSRKQGPARLADLTSPAAGQPPADKAAQAALFLPLQ